MFLKCSYEKTLEKNCGRPLFLEELKVARNVWKVSPHFKKTPDSFRKVLYPYSEICIFCVLKNCLPEAVGEEIYIIINLGLKYEVDLGY